ncbi:hypothetical protein I7I50_01354 [Histoplasma capsulatum G186AR]|uniref:Uncharacterized protein n=1 Tax=Ajellomyces capsulatus TaxID=5037 RepID=A0A8H7YAK7_AJECA|nr:hypothetical protein I7I52_12470 [Histoplasma capsulatum]QSS73253.1 hypothetical protein I7I50_01354 [Histoplasma capsulatum G186AR]
MLSRYHTLFHYPLCRLWSFLLNIGIVKPRLLGEQTGQKIETKDKINYKHEVRKVQISCNLVPQGEGLASKLLVL